MKNIQKTAKVNKLIYILPLVFLLILMLLFVTKKKMTTTEKPYDYTIY